MELSTVLTNKQDFSYYGTTIIQTTLTVSGDDTVMKINELDNAYTKSFKHLTNVIETYENTELSIENDVYVHNMFEATSATIQTNDDESVMINKVDYTSTLKQRHIILEPTTTVYKDSVLNTLTTGFKGDITLQQLNSNTESTAIPISVYVVITDDVTTGNTVYTSLNGFDLNVITTQPTYIKTAVCTSILNSTIIKMNISCLLNESPKSEAVSADFADRTFHLKVRLGYFLNIFCK
jgi:hypothetical protein